MLKLMLFMYHSAISVQSLSVDRLFSVVAECDQPVSWNHLRR